MPNFTTALCENPPVIPVTSSFDESLWVKYGNRHLQGREQQRPAQGNSVVCVFSRVSIGAASQEWVELQRDDQVWEKPCLAGDRMTVGTQRRKLASLNIFLTSSKIHITCLMRKTLLQMRNPFHQSLLMSALPGGCVSRRAWECAETGCSGSLSTSWKREVSCICEKTLSGL